MAEHSTIEWTDATWNPITGCSVVSPGCTNCYAMRLAGTRMKHHPSRAGLTRDTKAGPVWTGEVRFNDTWVDQPLRWKRPRMIFVCAHGDLFHEAVPDAWIDQVFAVMAQARHHTFQVLTKRAERMRVYLSAFLPSPPKDGFITRGGQPAAYGPYRGPCFNPKRWPLPNVWLGVSAEDQHRADERIPDLLATPAAVRWVSAEPLIGPVDLRPHLVGHEDNGVDLTRAPGSRVGTCIGWTPSLDWVVAGGESGPGARPMHPAWARSLRDQCAGAGVAFHFKQWGEWAPICAMTDAEVDACYHPVPAAHPEASRRVKVGQTVLHSDGTRFDDVAAPGAYQQGGNAMMMLALGKAKAGRLLDGREHNEVPG